MMKSAPPGARYFDNIAVNCKYGANMESVEFFNFMFVGYDNLGSPPQHSRILMNVRPPSNLFLKRAFDVYSSLPTWFYNLVGQNSHSHASVILRPL